MCTTVAVYSQHSWSHTVLYCTCGCENMYIIQSIHIWERVQDEKKQERQKCPAGTSQTDGKNWGLVWRSRKKISLIIKDYFHLPFFLLIILCTNIIVCGKGKIFSFTQRTFYMWAEPRIWKPMHDGGLSEMKYKQARKEGQARRWQWQDKGGQTKGKERQDG